MTDIFSPDMLPPKEALKLYVQQMREKNNELLVATEKLIVVVNNNRQEYEKIEAYIRDISKNDA